MPLQKGKERNFDGIRHEGLRRLIDPKYNAAHDELSACYYGKRPFRDYGVLTKETFDDLHGLIFLKWEVEFHDRNIREGHGIPESEYDQVLDGDGKVVGTRSAEAGRTIAELEAKGVKLVI